VLLKFTRESEQQAGTGARRGAARPVMGASV
jgi:hypothetical protein